MATTNIPIHTQGANTNNIGLLQSPSNDQVSIPGPQSTIRPLLLFPENQPIHAPNISSWEPTYTTLSDSSSNSSTIQSAQLIASWLLGSPGSHDRDISFNTSSMNSFCTAQSHSSNRWTYSQPDADELHSLSEKLRKRGLKTCKRCSKSTGRGLSYKYLVI